MRDHERLLDAGFEVFVLMHPWHPYARRAKRRVRSVRMTRSWARYWRWRTGSVHGAHQYDARRGPLTQRRKLRPLEETEP